MKKDRIWLILILFVAFGLRLFRLGEQSLWYDEGVTWMLSQMRSITDLIQWTAADIQPPLYYLLIWATDIQLGGSEWALRFPSVLFNTLTIPLLYILARRLATPHTKISLPFLTILIFAVSPLMIYYSQEARMYTLLVFEATLASYLLLKIFDNRSQSPRHPFFYALTISAALYTHYFAAFLIVVHGLYFGLILWQRGWTKSRLIQAGQMFGLAALLFGPWLPTLFGRLGDDPSYWPGALKLDEAIRKVFISFSIGETVFEQTGGALTLGYLVILIICGLWLTLPAPSDDLPSRINRGSLINQHLYLFLALWLLLPIMAILTLSYRSPKFNPRYTLVAYPAFCLILATALTYLRKRQYINRSKKFLPRLLFPNLILTVFILFILGTSTFSLYNWFTDPRFSKDDFKAMAQFVQERIAPDETVLLSSGHLFPVWAYYFGWDNWTPLPWLQRLDVNKITDLTISEDIAAATAGKEGVWLVTWQDEVIDPNGVVPFWLDRIGERPVDAGDFWGVGLEHWRINPRQREILVLNPITQPAAKNQATDTVYNFADKVELLGHTQINDTDLVLFWRPLQPLPEDLILTLDLTDKDGHDWDKATFTGRLGSEYYPPSHWPVGEVITTRHQLPWQIGSPPGLYIAEIGLGQLQETPSSETALNSTEGDFHGWDLLDAQGRPQRRTALIDFVNLSHVIEPEGGTPPIAADPQVDFLPVVSIRRAILPKKMVEPGDRLLLALLWQAGEYNVDDISIIFDLTDAQGQTFRVGNSYTPSREYNLPRWQPGQVVLGQYWLDIPPEAAPGPAQLQIHLINVTAFPYDEVFALDELEILPTARNFTPPTTLDTPLEANFSDQATLIGLDCEAGCQAAPGASLTLTLFWQADSPFAKSYTVFTHLLDHDETVLVNADHAPPKPTQGWVTGEIIADTITLALPSDLAPGSYPLEIGLYDAADPAYTRLPLSNSDTRLLLLQLIKVD